MKKMIKLRDMIENGIDCIGITLIFFCHDGAGKYLLNKRSEFCRDEHGRWDPGGGALKFGESVETGLFREVAEEYRVIPQQIKFLGYRDTHRIADGKKSHWVTLDFKVMVDPNEVKNGEPEKFEAVEWFSLSDLPFPLHSQLESALDKYSDQLI